MTSWAENMFSAFIVEIRKQGQRRSAQEPVVCKTWSRPSLQSWDLRRGLCPEGLAFLMNFFFWFVVESCP